VHWRPRCFCEVESVWQWPVFLRFLAFLRQNNRGCKISENFVSGSAGRFRFSYDAIFLGRNNVFRSMAVKEKTT